MLDSDLAQSIVGGDLALVFGGILMGMAALLMLFGAFIAYRARKARSWFNESRLIALSIYNFMFCLAVAIPLTFIMKVSFSLIHDLNFRVGHARMCVCNCVIVQLCEN